MPPPPKRKKPLGLRIRAWIYRIRTYTTPLDLRGSVTRLRRLYDWPVLALLRLMIPLPSWKFSLHESPAAVDMLGNVELEDRLTAGMTDYLSIPLWRARDTPLRCLYRMYQAMASGVYEDLGKETEYFWYQRNWSLWSIRDPLDPDPVRYAIIACLLEELVIALNWRLSLGMRRNRNHITREKGSDPHPPYNPADGPLWTSSVPPIPDDVLKRLPPEHVSDGKLILEAGGLSDLFASRNIVTNVGWLYTI